MSQTLADSPLGKAIAYPTQYDPAALFPMSRQDNREALGLAAPLPFSGVDIWNAYELSWLNSKGKPQVAIAEIYIPYDSVNLIESKSLKLYLNSFSMMSFTECDAVKHTIEKDLSAAVQADVQVVLLSPGVIAEQQISRFPGQCLDNLDVTIEHYKLHPDYLFTGEQDVEEQLYSDLLKSNCPVNNGQPDWASVYIHYGGKKIDQVGLLKYLISFRNNCEFAEQCVERIFVDIMQRCAPQKLTVYARYTRRGGIDINPFRSNFSKVPNNARLSRQ